MYKLYNGDCLEVMKLIPDKSIDLVCIDPPYFIIPKGKPNDKFSWDNFENMDTFLNFTNEWFNILYEKVKDNTFIYIFWSQKHLKDGFNLFNPSRLIFWNYDNLVLGGNGDWCYDYEPIFVIKKGNPKLINGKHSSKLNYTKPQSNFKVDKLIHPTQKSLKLMEYLINVSSNENDIVLDCFMGSGTTGVACMNLNRQFIGIELDENYHKIAEERIRKTKEQNEIDNVFKQVE